MTTTSYESIVNSHYRDQAREVKLDETSTMPDLVVREKELSAIFATLEAIAPGKRDIRILEIGCGNGVLLQHLHDAGYSQVKGMDYLPEFVALAQSRALPYDVRVEDARSLSYGDGEFDVVIAERVIINLKDAKHQAQAFAETRRVLKRGGYFIAIEAFEDSLINMNEARAEFGLTPVPMPEQNRWFKPSELEAFIEGKFESVCEVNGVAMTPRNFLSSHYFMSRVVHELLAKLRSECPDGFASKGRNSHFAQFFGHVLPPHGNYAGVQFLCLKAK